MKNITIAKNTLYQAAARITTSFIGFLITIIVASKFGVLGYGDFTKITSYVAMFYLLVDFGLNAVFLQEEKYSFKKLLYLRLLISLFVFVILNAVSFIIPFNVVSNSGFSVFVKLGILLFSLGIFLQAIIISTAAIFQKRLNYLPYMLGMTVGSLVNLISVLVLTFLNFSLVFVFVAFLFSSLVSSVILLYFTKERIYPPVVGIAFSKDILLKSLPLGLMLIFNLIYFRIDIILLSVFKGTADVGIYGLAYKFFDFLIALPLFLSNAIYPVLIKKKENANEFMKFVKKYFYIFLALSVVLIIPFWFVSPLFALIKQDFLPSIIPFRILLLSLPFFFTTSLLQWALIALQRQKYLMYVYVFSAVVNILLNIIYIPKYSYIAASTITLFSESIIFMFLSYKIFLVKKIFEKE
jgi:O-antigen/teichoic acid export membrane protein